MFKNLRQNSSVLTVVIIFLALIFAVGAESAQTSKKSAKPTATPKKNAKAAPTPSKKAQAKATPTPKKSSAPTTVKSKTADKKNADKKTAAKTTAKDNSKTQSSKDKGKTQKTTAKTPAAKNTKDTKSSSAKTAATSKTVKDSKTKDAKTKDTKTAAVKSSTASKNTPAKKSAPAKTQPASKTPASNSTDSAQIVVTDVSARIRSQAKSTAPELSKVKLGTALNVVEKTPAWYRVKYTDGGKTASGWIPASSVSKFDIDNKDQIYSQIANRQYRADGMDFATAAAVYEFLTAHESDFENSSSASDLELKRLLALRAALKSIPAGAKDSEPYKDFLRAHNKEIVYSEPSAEYLPTANLFWDLHKKYKDSALADQIAWEGSQNPLPGECEGYVNCHLFYARMTSGEYLNLHPTGKRNLEALTNLTNILAPIVADLDAKSVYNGPTDVTDRAEFNNLIAELRTIVSRLPLTEKEKTLQQLKRIAEGFR